MAQWEEYIISKLYKKGKKEYWDWFIEKKPFKDILSDARMNFDSPNDVVDLIHHDHNL